MTMPYDTFAEVITANYRLFLKAIAGVYQGKIAAGVTISPSSITDFVKEAELMAETFISTLCREDALYSSELNNVDRSVELIRGAKAAVVENIAQISKIMRIGAGEQGKSLRYSHGAIGLLLQRKLGAIEFKLYDTAGRKWDAVKLMEITSRDFAYQSWIDQQVRLLRNEGISIAYIQRDAARDSERGFAFSIGEPVDGYPTFSEIRSKVFHVNSTARIVGHV